MDFRPEHYFQAAIQRMKQANHLYQEGRSFALSIYVGGVAVECMLRAFKMLRDPSFDDATTCSACSPRAGCCG